MYHLLLYLLYSSLLHRSQSQSANTIIGSIWRDDFVEVSTEADSYNGWYIWSGNPVGDSSDYVLNDRIIQGDNYDYHGPFTRESESSNQYRNNNFKRYFKCDDTIDSTGVYLSYYVGFCDTSSSIPECIMILLTGVVMTTYWKI